MLWENWAKPDIPMRLCYPYDLILLQIPKIGNGKYFKFRGETVKMLRFMLHLQSQIEKCMMVIAVWNWGTENIVLFWKQAAI